MAETKLFPNFEPVFKNNNGGVTKFDVKMFNYRWDILQFMSLPKKTGEFCDANIPTDGQSCTTWYLRVYPNGKDGNHKDYASVYLLSWSKNEVTVKTRYSIELRDSSDNVIVSQSCEYAEFPPKSEHGFSNLIKRDTLQKGLEKSINGTLTINCTVWEFTDVENESVKFSVPIQKPMETHSTSVLKTLLKDQTYSDFTINVKERQFKVHKAILHTCSPVFATMLSTKMQESVKNVATVDDVEPDVFEKLLEFMYAGSVATIKDDAMELVPVAHKYDLKGLLEECEAVLCSQVSMDLAVKLLVLSNVYSLEYLKKVTVKYIKANLNGVSQTADWKTHVETDSQLLLSIFMP